MGIGIQAIGLLEEILEKKQFNNCKTLIELGSQDIDSNLAKKLLKKINKTYSGDVILAKDFYNEIGFNEYACIDADGKHNALKFDLNLNIVEKYKFEKKYDLVTNFGTSEHLINQKTFFENAHNLTKPNGYMLHLLPFEGYLNHGYFNYQPKFFYDLAIFNDYEIIGFWYFSERFSLNFLHYSGRHSKPLKYDDKLLEFLDELAIKRKFFMIFLNNTSSIAILYKKNLDKEFKSPFDSMFLQANNIEGYSISNIENKKKFFDYKINHQKQIEEILGNTYWKIKLKKLFSDKQYRKIFFKKVIFDNEYKKLLVKRFFRFFKYLINIKKLIPWK